MFSQKFRPRPENYTWPGFVDALASLLMVIIFVLMVFVIAQFYVSQKLSKLRYSVPEYINSNPNLLNFVSTISMAKLEDGGDGAIVIKLKKL